MNREDIIAKVVNFVKQKLINVDSGHDWYHTERVWEMAKYIAEDYDVDLLIVELGALLHDVCDHKFCNIQDKRLKEVRTLLEECGLDNQKIEHIENIIRYTSFSKRDECNFDSKELKIVQDADRLDAIGAIGIARTFNYGGFKDLPLHVGDNSTISHFYKKLLKLKDLMNTEKAKKIAEERHKFMLDFLTQFYKEWEMDYKK